MSKITGGLNRLKKETAALKSKIEHPKNKYQKQSYSQSGEDLIIDFIFTQLGITKPSYLDIGAHHPFYLSNTALFYQKGGKGINVEPDPELFNRFPAYRKNDTNLNCGIGNEAAEMCLHVMNEPALNTFSGEEAERLVKEHHFKIVNKITTPIKTVSSIVQQYNNGIYPDLLSVDVEGFDEAIIKSINFNQSPPTVICLETITYSDSGNGIKDDEIINYVKSQGYMVYADTNINTIFVLEEKWKRK
ncbi:MAG: FkbM family methyltransferase [Bacteroidota bacterium]|nr:FkbM family methyltransferase [Bacteroidota bacterium]